LLLKNGVLPAAERGWSSAGGEYSQGVVEYSADQAVNLTKLVIIPMLFPAER
jgi:hypothetical protein